MITLCNFCDKGRYVLISKSACNFVTLCTRRVLRFGLFIIFPYCRESSGSVTKVHSSNAYSIVMFLGRNIRTPLPSLPLPLIFRRIDLCVSQSIQNTKGLDEEKKRKRERKRERERVESSSFILGKMHR
jgi:hypothetical protein